MTNSFYINTDLFNFILPKIKLFEQNLIVVVNKIENILAS